MTRCIEPRCKRHRIAGYSRCDACLTAILALIFGRSADYPREGGMRPGSSDRCKSKAPDGRVRCNRVAGHEGGHQAKRRDRTVWWYSSPANTVLTLSAVPA